MAAAQEHMITGPDAMAMGLVMTMIVVMPMSMVVRMKAVVVGHGVSLAPTALKRRKI
jgi:hypothetical protein